MLFLLWMVMMYFVCGWTEAGLPVPLTAPLSSPGHSHNNGATLEASKVKCPPEPLWQLTNLKTLLYFYVIDFNIFN